MVSCSFWAFSQSARAALLPASPPMSAVASCRGLKGPGMVVGCSKGTGSFSLSTDGQSHGRRYSLGSSEPGQEFGSAMAISFAKKAGGSVTTSIG